MNPACLPRRIAAYTNLPALKAGSLQSRCCRPWRHDSKHYDWVVEVWVRLEFVQSVF